jgi:hypothetical protein
MSVFLLWLSDVQVALFLRRIIFSSVARLVVPRVSTLFHNWRDFHKTFTERKMFDFLYCLSETFHILRGDERDVIINVKWPSIKVPLILVRR